MSILITVGIFILTLFLILVRPRGLNESWATMIGAALMLLTGQETFQQAILISAGGMGVLVFLFALMVLSNLLDRSGFFEWSAIWAARWAKGNDKSLYRNVFILGAVRTALLSLDTTAIILTPIVLSFVRRLKLPSLPFLIACAFIANTGSLLLPVSNLTNFLFQGALHFSFAAFALRMIIPQLVVVILNYLLFKYHFNKVLPATFEIADLPEPGSVIIDKGYFKGAVTILIAVTIGYFIGSFYGIAPYVIALTGAALLFCWGLIRRQVNTQIVKSISWSLFPFIIGLFIVIQGVENLGLAKFAARGLVALQHSPLLLQMLGAGLGTAIGSNVINNIPMAMLSVSTLKEAHAFGMIQYAALIGCNIGPNLTVAGLLATMLVITSARQKGETMGAWDFLR
jgi:arsenical pump membrane protein